MAAMYSRAASRSPLAWVASRRAVSRSALYLSFLWLNRFDRRFSSAHWPASNLTSPTANPSPVIRPENPQHAAYHFLVLQEIAKSGKILKWGENPTNCMPGREYIEGTIMSTTTNSNWIDELFGVTPDGPPNGEDAPAKPVKTRAEKQRYNLAIWRLMSGKGSPAEEIAVLTGLSPLAVSNRYWRFEREGSEEDKESLSGVYTDAERKYLLRQYGRLDCPEVKSFVADVVRNGRPDRSDPERN